MVDQPLPLIFKATAEIFAPAQRRGCERSLQTWKRKGFERVKTSQHFQYLLCRKPLPAFGKSASAPSWGTEVQEQGELQQPTLLAPETCCTAGAEPRMPRIGAMQHGDGGLDATQ